MSESFDDIIRRQLDGHESPVRPDLYDKIRNHADVRDALFDGAIKTALISAETPVPEGIFDKVELAADLGNLSVDNSLKNKLVEFASPVPEDMWARIQRKKDRKRPAAWWMAAGVLFLLGTATWFAIKHSHNTGTIYAFKITPVKGKNTAAQQGACPPLSNQTTNRQDTGDSVPAYPAVATKPAAEAVNKVVEVKRLANGANTNRQKIDSSLVKAPFDPGKWKQDLVSSSELGHFGENSYSYNFKKSNTDPENNSDFFDSSDNDNQLPVLAEDDKMLSTARLHFIQQFRNAAKLTPGQLLKAAKSFTPVTPCPTTGDLARNDWYVDVYASALLLNKKITDKAAGKNAKFGFDSTLHQQVSVNAGVNLVKNMGENFLLKTGVQYNRINEAFRMTRINERRIITTISVRTVILSPGDTVYIRDTSRVEQVGTIQRGKQNAYTQWDVPLILGYEFGGSNVRINANAGIIANIRSSYQGEMLDTLQQVKDINNFNGKPVYRRNVGLSLYAGFSILKQLGNRTSLLVEPHARFGLRNTAMDSIWFTQKNTLIGISVGIRYKLNGNRQRIY